jgi:multidrug efflux pump subunit AcrB
MVGIVRLALRRPYTFVVMVLLIMIFGVASGVRTPTDRLAATTPSSISTEAPNPQLADANRE